LAVPGRHGGGGGGGAEFKTVSASVELEFRRPDRDSHFTPLAQVQVRERVHTSQPHSQPTSSITTIIQPTNEHTLQQHFNTSYHWIARSDSPWETLLMSRF
jgi:hypothetical protein